MIGKIFNLYIYRNFLVFTIFGVKISVKLKYSDSTTTLVLNNNVKEKKLIIVRIDAIGDFILFRNFLNSIRHEYKDYHITYIGNILCKEIILHFDKDYIDECIFINTQQGNNDLDFLKKLKYDIVLSPTYSISPISQHILKNIKADEKIGFYPNLSNLSISQKIYCNQYSTKTIHFDKEFDFEFNINKYFFENLLNKKIDVYDTKFKLDEKMFDAINFNFSEKYIIIFPSATAHYRRWDTDNFRKVSEYIYKKYGYNIYILGSNSDKKLAKEIIDDNNKNHIKSLCGKYKLHELVYIMNKSILVISNDTMAYHMAVASNTNVICLSNANTYTRFVKYPDDLIKGKKVIQVLPERFTNSSLTNNDYEYYSNIDINEIKPEAVIKEIENIL